MLVREIMTRADHLLVPHSGVQHIARLVRDDVIRSLPMTDGDRLMGYVTDCDLVVRGLAEGLLGDTYTEGVMTEQLNYRFSAGVEGVATNMAQE